MEIDKENYPNCFKGMEYVKSVLSGRIPQSKYIIGACSRFISDLESGKYVFDIAYSERYLRLVQNLEHPIGEWKTRNIQYEPWQCWIWMNALGFKLKDTGLPRFRFLHIEVPRGASKSTMASQCALYFLALDSDKGNQIAATATRKEQARIVLDSARVMARRSSSYLKKTGVKVLAHTIIQEKTNSKMVALSSDHSGLDGLNLRIAFLDELHAMRRETFDVIVSGMNKRPDSITIALTTAGFDTEGVGYSQSQYAKRVCTGEVEDEQFFSVVYTVDDEDDIFKESTWIKANPNYGVSVDPITFAAKAKKAKETPADLPNFKVKLLNIWLSESRAFFNLQKWDKCADPGLTIEKFKGKQCIVGVDLASKIDLTSLAFIFYENEKYYIFDRSYIPEETVAQVRNTLYDNCIGAGHLISTKGEAIHYPQLIQETLDLSKSYRFLEVLYDPWNATEFAQRLSSERVNMIEFKMNTANLSEPTKRLDALIREGQVVHNGSPLLRWAIGNVVCKEDAAGNVFPRKTHERLKIDPAIAIIMALASYIQKEREKSVYEKRGIRKF